MEVAIAVLVGVSILFLLLPTQLKKQQSYFKQFTIEELTPKAKQQTANPTLKKLLRWGHKIPAFIPFYLLPINQEKLRKHLMLAGIERDLSMDEVITLKKVSAMICFGMFALFFLLSPSLLMMSVVLLVTIIGFYIPDNMLGGRAQKRQWKIQKEIPSTLTTLAIITDAGLNLFQAMDRLSQDSNSELSQELKLTVDNMKLGMSQKEAFERFAQRCSIEEVHYFISAVLQGLQKGNSGLTQIIRQQADESWDKRKKKAKELAGEASIKLFLPLLLMVFPAFMIFLMGPMVFSLVQLFR